MCTRNGQFLTCSSFFPYSVKVTDMFFEILKEGTEQNEKFCFEGNAQYGECEKKEA